ncbi:hypothetical protein [Paenibacillus sp. L3-i20]|uniref:hypothetical protein n=1 Tax=Paenibacillus sp. L3-i20 TaxID=2905833 RepID=UPI001EDDB7CD|nr:hypothetical protein [Paenibacillus sp. L3-i20]GKU79833.1 hypothetical protein L3i20_v242300 [Paenibacillus sp. L3-i20]
MKFYLTSTGMCEAGWQSACVNPMSQEVKSLLERIKAGAKIIIEHIDCNKTVYRIGAITLAIMLGGIDIVSAASGGIDAGAQMIYTKLVNVGKWVIIIKGGFDTINATVQGDFVTARKSFLSYLLVYVVLLGLPWAFEQVETLFLDVT